MRKLLTLFLFTIISINSFSQSDLLVLKQKNQVIQTWVTGSSIDFQFSSKQWIQGIIKTIRNDSILIEQATDAIMVTDLQGDLKDVNSALCAMFGYTKEELLQLNVRSLLAYFTYRIFL